MRWLALALLLGCSTSRSAEREDSFAQAAAGRVETGSVRVVRTEEHFGRLSVKSFGPVATSGAPAVPTQGPLLSRIVTVEDRAPVISTSTATVEASGEAKEARSARFGFSPWQWAIGGLVVLAGLYGLFRLKARLAL